ncbi:MAG: single-stranded-DNA-specific exonuclease RecJ [Deltaproteobacteria bacterium]|nr:single-stranded-DNA-specific exonuclease RecJ [Deltaproteobacteria bacterium]
MALASKNFSENPDWEVLPRNLEKENELIKALSITPLTAHLLIQRGIDSPDLADKFLNPDWKDLPDLDQIPDMDRAVERLIQAFQKRERILVYGDYDVDGITATAQLLSFFEELGHPIESHIPHRIDEGYGLNIDSLKKILAQKPVSLLVTVDTGTNAHQEIAYLKERKIDVIVIDHHQTPETRPPVIALLNPKLPGSRFQEPVCSAGLVFLLLLSLRAELRRRGFQATPNLRRYLDLACLGTIADIVPLTGVNRLLVKGGLKEIAETKRPGLIALLEKSQTKPPLRIGSVSFRLIPRLNAAGRIANPNLALELLLEKGWERAELLADELEQLNRQRQKIEEDVLTEALQMLANNPSPKNGIVVAKSGWHLGVVGIVAARLVEKFNRPSIVLSLENGLGRGSARTVPGFSVYNALQQIKDLMVRFGGHHQAAGITLKEENLKTFSERFDQVTGSLLNSSPPRLSIDALISLQEINFSLVHELSLLEPYGPGNHEPLFATHPVSFSACRIVGENHLKGKLVQNEAERETIGFDFGHYLKQASSGLLHRIAFGIQTNHWNGIDSIQLVLKEINLI